MSHIVSGDRSLSVPGHGGEHEFGDIRILRRERNRQAARQWQVHTPTIVEGVAERVMRQIKPEAPAPPANLGIRFADRDMAR